MASNVKQELLRKLPSISDLLATETVAAWLAEHPRGLVTECLRVVVADLRRQILADEAGRCAPRHVTEEFVLTLARQALDERTQPHLRPAVNATGIILHTGLGRAVWPQSVVDSLARDLKGYVTLEVDRETGLRSARDRRIEYLLTELTGAEAATVVNNNAAATTLVLSALAAEKEVVISRGQLIEIGGAFRLPDVMAQSRARMVEVGTTNRTHLRDYEAAVTDQTAVILRVHPSNYRILGFTATPTLAELVALAHSRSLILVDDLGAGALVALEQFGLPHEPTMGESIAAGADVVLASADKLMGAGQGGVIVGRKEYIDRVRKHPLARAVRVDKTCLMALERTLMLFRDVELLKKEHPTYRMLAAPLSELRRRARSLAAAIRKAAPQAQVELLDGVGFLGSGSLPMEQLPTRLVSVTVEGLEAADLARRLRMDQAAVFTRIEDGRVLMDVRTVQPHEIPQIAAAVGRARPDKTGRDTQAPCSLE